MKFFLYGAEIDNSSLLSSDSASFLIQLTLAGDTGEVSAVIKTTSSLPGAATKVAEHVVAVLLSL